MRIMERQKETFLLTSENMNEATKRISCEMEQCGEKEDRLRIRIAFEDILDIWQRALGQETECTIRYGKRFGRWSVQLSAVGARTDPVTDSSSTDLELAGNVILQGLGLFPTFEYKNGVNDITLSLPKNPPNQVISLLCACVLSVALGLLTSHAPSAVRSILVDALAKPILDMLLGVLSGVAMPMIFLSISIGIVNMSNIASLGRIGKSFLSRFIAVAFAVPILTILLSMFTVKLSTKNTEVGGFQAIFAMLIDIVPMNLVSPFIEGNAIQIIFLGFCVGVALLMLGDKMHTLTDCMKQLQEVINIFMNGINRLLPLFVFLTFYGLTASGSVGKLGGVVQISVVVAANLILLTICFTVYFCWRLRAPVRVLIKKMMPSFIVTLATASSMASFAMRVESCKNDFGLDGKLTDFAIPLAQVLLKPEAGILYAISALCVGNIYGVPITPMWLVMCSLVSSLLSIATPPVPGGCQVAYTALFLQLGIPPEGLVLALAAGAIFDFITSAISCYTQMLLIFLTADKLGKLDKDVLRSANSAHG